MENLPKNLRGTVAQLAGIELRRPQNLYMHMTSEGTQQKDGPVFGSFEDFFNEIKDNKTISFLSFIYILKFIRIKFIIIFKA